jgi:peptidoglycan hydrolase CwlO-like protein
MRYALRTLPLPLRFCLLLALLLAGITAAVASASASSTGDLEGKISSSKAREGALRASIQADTGKIAGFQGSIDDLHTRLQALQSSLDIENRLLKRLEAELDAARITLATLQRKLAHDKQVLIAQVVADYETPAPDIVTVLLEARGFADLLERVNELRAIGRQNAATTLQVKQERTAVAEQANRLSDLQQRQQRQTTAVLVQRDEVAQLRLTLVDRQLRYVRARAAKSAELSSLTSHRQALERELSTLQAQESAAERQSYSATGPISVGPLTVATEGEYGFFPAPGTNYTVGSEPELTARLNALGKALHLHLIGISGYRTPEHSVEVGGFANDPHTRGEASDTPGVEGVPESVLERFGLERPFPGPAEADHIQLLGSPL